MVLTEYLESWSHLVGYMRVGVKDQSLNQNKWIYIIVCSLCYSLVIMLKCAKECTVVYSELVILLKPGCLTACW